MPAQTANLFLLQDLEEASTTRKLADSDQLHFDLAKQSATEASERTIDVSRMQRFTTGNLTSENT